MRKGKFTSTTVGLDNGEFIECEFHDCKLVYKGGKLPTFQRCVFNNCRFAFDEGASNTINFMTALYGIGFTSLIEETFNNIRGRRPVSGFRGFLN